MYLEHKTIIILIESGVAIYLIRLGYEVNHSKKLLFIPSVLKFDNSTAR